MSIDEGGHLAVFCYSPAPLQERHIRIRIRLRLPFTSRFDRDAPPRGVFPVAMKPVVDGDSGGGGRALPTGSKRAAAFLLSIAAWGVYTWAIGGADDSSIGGQRQLVATYVAQMVKGAWARSGDGNATARGDGGNEDVARADTGVKARPGIGVRAYPQAKANPQNVIMTMIAGNGPARHAVAMIQSLRDVGTQADAIVVMLQQGGMGSPECHDSAWRKANNLPGVEACSGPDAIAEEIVSPFYLNILKARGRRAAAGVCGSVRGPYAGTSPSPVFVGGPRRRHANTLHCPLAPLLCSGWAPCS